MPNELSAPKIVCSMEHRYSVKSYEFHVDPCRELYAFLKLSRHPERNYVNEHSEIDRPAITIRSFRIDG